MTHRLAPVVQGSAVMRGMRLHGIPYAFVLPCGLWMAAPLFCQDLTACGDRTT